MTNGLANRLSGFGVWEAYMGSDFPLRERAMGRFMTALEHVRLSSGAKRYCEKWVADYLEFASARHHSADDLSLLPLYLGKMERVGRTRFQVDQARWAVLFFLKENEPDISAAGSVSADKLAGGKLARLFMV